ncbi:MAG: deoxynucleoside kinase [Planctomycetota bacterium]
MTGALISLVGAPGSGKTTVAQWLAPALDGRFVLEDYAGNPFLAASYEGADALRLPGQLWFLLSRVNQLADGRLGDGETVVSDYGYLQDRIYAEIWLTGADLETYRRVAARVAPLVRPADVLVLLDGPVSLLMERITQRGRGYEQRFTEGFVRRLRDTYRRRLAAETAAVVRVDIARRDLRDETERRWLVDRIGEALPRATRDE